MMLMHHLGDMLDPGADPAQQIPAHHPHGARLDIRPCGGRRGKVGHFGKHRRISTTTLFRWDQTAPLFKREVPGTCCLPSRWAGSCEMLLSIPTWSWPFPHWAVDILYFAIAAFVTVDVLIKKGDVRAALGWIAAAWLSPLVGGLLYYLFGINRVTRRALRLARRGIALHDRSEE